MMIMQDDDCDVLDLLILEEGTVRVVAALVAETGEVW